MSSTIRYCFYADYYDYQASLVRKYQLYFYPEDNSIEMFDVKNKKIFLKRIVYKELNLKDLFVGADLTIYSRKLKIVEYADGFTKSYFQEQRNSTYSMIKPNAYLNIGKIIDQIYQAGYVISKLKLIKMKPEEAREFYVEHKGKEFYQRLVEFMSSDYIVPMEIIGADIIQSFRNFIGPTDVMKAKQESPNSIRALYGETVTRNAIHASDSHNSAKRETEFIFGQGRFKSVPQLTNCSCLIIKPHAIFEGNAGKIIDIVLSEGFEISCMEMFYLDKVTAEEFFEVYKGVLPEYSGIIDEITSGPIIAMEIRQDNVVNTLRTLVGPHDPEIAKTLRPNTLRACFGKDRVKNAVHCTDLPEDGVLEVQYYFELLQEK